MKAALGRVVHVFVDPAINNGSPVAPATIVRVFPSPNPAVQVVNLRVFLDGPPGPHDWATSRYLHVDEETARSAQGDAAAHGVGIHAFWPARV